MIQFSLQKRKNEILNHLLEQPSFLETFKKPELIAICADRRINFNWQPTMMIVLYLSWQTSIKEELFNANHFLNPIS